MSQIRDHVSLLVVGAGPAGASAARIAAAAGANTLLIDRARAHEKPVQCAEWVPAVLSRYKECRSARIQSVGWMETFLPSGEGSLMPFKGLMIDRAVFDEALISSAVEKGARILYECFLLGLDAQNKIASVRMKGEVRLIRYDVLVAADGTCSNVARYLGLPSLHKVWTRQYTVPLLKSSDRARVWLSSEYKGAYAWLFPKGEVANLGVGYSTSREDGHGRYTPKISLDRLHGQLVESGQVGASILYRTGGALPVSGLREPLVFNEVLFAGDAAGCANPLTGAGISAAIVSGEMAGKAAGAFLASGKPAFLEEYESAMQEVLASSMKRDLCRREDLIRAWSFEESECTCRIRKSWPGFKEYLY